MDRIVTAAQAWVHSEIKFMILSFWQCAWIRDPLRVSITYREEEQFEKRSNSVHIDSSCLIPDNRLPLEIIKAELNVLAYFIRSVPSFRLRPFTSTTQNWVMIIALHKVTRVGEEACPLGFTAAWGPHSWNRFVVFAWMLRFGASALECSTKHGLE